MTTETQNGVDLASLPQQPGLLLLGNLLRVDPTRIHPILEDWARQNGNFYQLKMAHRQALVVTSVAIRGT